MKNNLKEALKRQTIFYLLIIVFSILLPSFTLNYISRPKKEHLFTAFISSYTTDREKIDGLFEKNKPDYVNKITINLFSNDDPNFNIYYSSFGLKHSDLIIIPESRINNPDIVTYYCSLSENIIDNYNFSNFYTIDDVSYGVKLNNGNNDIGDLLTLSKEGMEEENYYMFLNKNSYHIGELGKTKYETAFTYMALLMNYEKE